jgi:hydrogenase 3 maturation protease
MLAGAKKIVLLGAGSDLRADDAAGLIVCRAVLKRLPKKQDRMTVILGETAPENFTGVILRLNPDLVILADTVLADQPPGTVMLFDPEKLDETNLFSTHKLPAKVLIQYLKLSLPGCRIVVVGIQPEVLDFGKKVTRAVGKAAAKVADLIRTGK